MRPGTNEFHLSWADRVGRRPLFAPLHRRIAHERLRRLRPGQSEAFHALKHGFAARLESVRGPAQEKFLARPWSEQNRALAKSLLPVPSESFLDSPVIKGEMTAKLHAEDIDSILANLKNALPAARAAELILEDFVGGPTRPILDLLTSDDHLHHLNDLIHFFSVTRADPAKLGIVVEWGGGYGCMAKLVWRFLAAPVTYVLIDTDVSSCVQWLYLTSILGPERTNHLRGPNDRIVEGKVNLLPVARLESQSELRADLFISTFALSESSSHAQEYVIERDWFGARHLLLAYDDRDFSEDAPNLLKRAVSSRGETVERVLTDGAQWVLR